jgi:hypothetical protein
VFLTIKPIKVHDDMTVFVLPVHPISPVRSEALSTFYFSWKTFAIAGTVANVTLVAGVVLSTPAGSTSGRELGRNKPISQKLWMLLQPYLNVIPPSVKKDICQGACYAVGAIAFKIAISLCLQTFLTNFAFGSLAVRWIQQISYSQTALAGVAFFLGRRTFSPPPPRSETPKEVNVRQGLKIDNQVLAQNNSDFNITGSGEEPKQLLAVTPSIPSKIPPGEHLPKEKPKDHFSIDYWLESAATRQKTLTLPPTKTTPKPIKYEPLNNCDHWLTLLSDIWAKRIFLEVFRNAKDFQGFHALSLVCKTWTRLLYDPSCLISASPLFFASRVFNGKNFYLSEIAAFFDKYLSPIKGLGLLSPENEDFNKTYQGEGLHFPSDVSDTLTCQEFLYIKKRLPQATFASLELLLREDTDVKEVGAALSTFLKGEKVFHLRIRPDRKEKPLSPSLIGKILTQEEKKELDAFYHDQWESRNPVPPFYPEKLCQFLRCLEGKVVFLELKEGWNDPSVCKAAMEKLKVKHLHFAPISYCDLKEEPFDEDLKTLFLAHVRTGTMITNTLEMAPNLKSLLFGQRRNLFSEGVVGEEPLKGLSLKSVQLEELAIQLVSPVESGELKTLLQTQTSLKKLILGLPGFKLLPTTFVGLPIESLTLYPTASSRDKSCDEVILGKALLSIAGTLKQLMLREMIFTGSCLQGLQLQGLHLYEIKGIQKEAFQQALLGRGLKKLILERTDITPEYLEGLEVEELRLMGEILDTKNQYQLYRLLFNMKQQGLKKLDLSDNSTLKERLKLDPAFRGIEFTTILSSSEK